MRGRASPVVASTLAVVALALAVVGLAAWRCACVLAGPDIDTDAYAHHMIARAILADPRDLSVHWVWLPLFHYLQVPLVALGGTMNDVRWANVALTAALPIVLFAYVRRTTATSPAERSCTSPDGTALVAALFAATCPIVMQMGTTAQPEPLFGLLVLGVAITYQRRRYGAATAMLGAAVLLRYEAWASLATIAAIAFAERAGRPWINQWRERRGLLPEDGPRPSEWAVVLVPTALILAWAALRRPVDGQWFGFIRQTHDFASEVAGELATHGRGAHAGSVMTLAKDALYYPIFVPWRVLGPALPLVAFGIPRTVRQQGARFVLVLAACLGFISLTWMKRASLGLDRHFVVVVPLYATFAAQGVAVVAEGVERIVRARWAGRAVAGVLSVASLGAMCVVLRVWMGFWRGSIERGWPERVALGAYLRSLPKGSPIFCDDATLEILSGVDRRRFDRHFIDDPNTWDLIEDTSRARGCAYVATWRRKLSGHEQDGEVLFRAGQVPGSPISGVEVMRFGRDAGRAVR